MSKLRFGFVFSAIALATLLLAAPTAAAVDGTICGQVTDFTAPTVATDGSLTIDGQAETIDSGATAAIDALTLTTVAALAATDATTCVTIDADSTGAIADVAIATTASFCGDVAFNTTTGAYSVDGVALAPSALSGDAEASAVLDAAASAGADACADVTVNAGDGLVADAAVRASIDACGTVVLESDGDATVGGVLVPAELTDPELRSVFGAAIAANAQACAAIDATSTGGDTSVTVTATAQVCLEVTAVTDSTITLENITFARSGSASGSIEVGDTVCAAVQGSTGGTPTATGIAGAAAGGAAPVGVLPDTAADLPALGTAAMVALLALGGLAAGGVAIRAEARRRR